MPRDLGILGFESAIPEFFFVDLQACPSQVSEETRLLRSHRVWIPSPVESDSILSCQGVEFFLLFIFFYPRKSNILKHCSPAGL